MDEFYGRAMPAPPARIEERDFVGLAQLYARHATVTNVRGERHAATTWSEIDVVQWIARQPGARGFYRWSRTPWARACATARWPTWSRPRRGRARRSRRDGDAVVVEVARGDHDDARRDPRRRPRPRGAGRLAGGRRRGRGGHGRLRERARRRARARARGRRGRARRRGGSGVPDAFGSGVHRSVGLEEELLLVDPARGHALAPVAQDVLSRMRRAGRRGGPRGVRRRARAALATVRHRRRGARRPGGAAGGRACRGRLPARRGRCTRPRLRGGADLVPLPRYARVEDDMRGLIRRTPECALHVHVGMPDREPPCASTTACAGTCRCWRRSRPTPPGGSAATPASRAPATRSCRPIRAAASRARSAAGTSTRRSARRPSTPAERRLHAPVVGRAAPPAARHGGGAGDGRPVASGRRRGARRARAVPRARRGRVRRAAPGDPGGAGLVRLRRRARRHGGRACSTTTERCGRRASSWPPCWTGSRRRRGNSGARQRSRRWAAGRAGRRASGRRSCAASACRPSWPRRQPEPSGRVTPGRPRSPGGDVADRRPADLVHRRQAEAGAPGRVEAVVAATRRGAERRTGGGAQDGGWG